MGDVVLMSNTSHPHSVQRWTPPGEKGEAGYWSK